MKQEQEIESYNPDSNFTTLFNRLNVDMQTRQKAVKLYNFYKSQLEEFDENVNQVAQQCALFIASKTTFIPTLDGRKVIASKIELHKLLKDNRNLKVFFTKLKEIQAKISLDEESSRQIKNVLNNFTFASLFFNKYLETSQLYFNIVQNQKLFEFGWIIFILSRHLLCNKRFEIVELAYLVAASLFFAIEYSPDKRIFKTILFTSVPKFGQEYQENTEFNMSLALQSLCQKLILKQERFLNVYSKVVSILVFFQQQNKLKIGSFQKYEFGQSEISDILNENLIEDNYRSLQGIYQSQLTSDDIDEGEFLINTQINKSPEKIQLYSPFVQSKFSKFSNQQIQEFDSNQMPNFQSNLREAQFQYPSSSPFIKAQVEATPITLRMEIDQ